MECDKKWGEPFQTERFINKKWGRLGWLRYQYFDANIAWESTNIGNFAR
jgi:hypothetical protein